MAKQKKRRTIGDDPLDALVPPTPPEPQSTSTPAKQKKQKTNFVLPVELIEEMKDAVVALSGPPLRLTMGALAVIALRAELERLRVEHNKGRAFPKRQGELRGGRPIGS